MVKFCFAKEPLEALLPLLNVKLLLCERTALWLSPVYLPRKSI